MRPLSATLLAAQQQASGAPLVQCVLRARRGAASRLDPTLLYAASAAEAPTAIALPSSGNAVRARLSGGTVQTQACLLAGSSAWNTWTALGAAVLPAGGRGIALAALADTVALAYLSASTTIAVTFSADGGATWGGAVTLSTASPVLDVALCYDAAADLLLVAGDSGGTLHAWRRPVGGSFGADTTLVPAGASSIGSVALAYAGDWLLLLGFASGSEAYLGAALFGNGGLQAVGTWSVVTNLLGLAAGSGPSLTISGFAWGQDGGHATLVEQWAITGGYNATPSYSFVCSTPQDFQAGRISEPEPFPYAGMYGCALACSQAVNGLYAASGHNLVQTMQAPADVDVSARVIDVKQEAASHHGRLEVVLDNADGLVSSLASASSIGLRLDLSFGYTTVVGQEYSQQPLRWVSAVHGTWKAGRRLLTVEALDAWQLLHQWQPRRQYSFGPALGLAALTVDQLLAWLLARAGVAYTPPAPSSLRSRTPNLQVLPGHDGESVLLDLLDKIEGWCLLGANGATVIPLDASDPVSYSYNAGSHPILQVFHQQEAQPANLISVYTGAHGQNLSAQAFDATEARLGGAAPHEHVDTQLEPANAQATANALLRKAQLSGPTHTLTTPPNLGQELGDVISFTDPLDGAVYRGRVRTYSLELDRDKGLWEMVLSLSAV